MCEIWSWWEKNLAKITRHGNDDGTRRVKMLSAMRWEKNILFFNWFKVTHNPNFKPDFCNPKFKSGCNPQIPFFPDAHAGNPANDRSLTALITRPHIHDDPPVPTPMHSLGDHHEYEAWLLGQLGSGPLQGCQHEHQGKMGFGDYSLIWIWDYRNQAWNWDYVLLWTN